MKGGKFKISNALVTNGWLTPCIEVLTNLTGGGSMAGLRGSLVSDYGAKDPNSEQATGSWKRKEDTDCTIFNKLSKYASFICWVTSTQSAELARPSTFQVVGSKCCSMEAEMPVSCGAMIWTAFSQ